MRNKRYTYKWIVMVCFMLWGCLCSAWAYEPYSPATAPTYQFHSTSSYTPQMTSAPVFTPLADDPYAGLAKQNDVIKGWNPWDENNPGDNPIGQVDESAPVGTPLVMLLMALMYIAFRVYRRKQA